MSGQYQELRVWAEMFHDAQAARIAATNRAERGGVHPDLYAGHITGLEDVEKRCGLELRRAFRRVAPEGLRVWQKESPGIGEHLLARLVGLIGDPVVASPFRWEQNGDGRHLVALEPYRRGVAQLRAYCGVGDPRLKRRKGMSQEEAFAAGVPLAKSLVRLMAEGCVKVNRGPYREEYDAARERYADRLHAEECPACGPKGKPAQVGSPWSLAHQHAAALRKVGKEILKDIWLACQDHPTPETYPNSVAVGES